MPDCQASDWGPLGFTPCPFKATLNITNGSLLPEGKNVCIAHLGSYIYSRTPNTVICLPPQA